MQLACRGLWAYGKDTTELLKFWNRIGLPRKKNQWNRVLAASSRWFELKEQNIFQVLTKQHSEVQIKLYGFVLLLVQNGTCRGG